MTCGKTTLHIKCIKCISLKVFKSMYNLNPNCMNENVQVNRYHLRFKNLKYVISR